VHCVLEGSIRRGGQRVRITGQLVDASTGAHIWADRFDGALEDIFDLQDQVTARVVASISPKIQQAEIQRAKRKPTENLDAYDYFLHGMALVHKYTREATSEALRLFHKGRSSSIRILHRRMAWQLGVTFRSVARERQSGGSASAVV
jgi:hypothetical protein